MAKIQPPSVEELRAWLQHAHDNTKELQEKLKEAKAKLVPNLRREKVNQINNEIDDLEAGIRESKLLEEERKAALVKAIDAEQEAQRRIAPADAAVLAFAGREPKTTHKRASGFEVVAAFGRVQFLRRYNDARIEAAKMDPDQYLAHAASCLGHVLRDKDAASVAEETALFLPKIVKVWAKMNNYSVPEVQEFALLAIGDLSGDSDDIVAISELPRRGAGPAEAA